MNPKPAPRRDKAFCVGVTGHRPNRLPERQWDRIKKELGEVLAELEAAHPRRRLVLLSGLAEGADRLAALIALGRGWSLRAVLAFHRTRFEQDFPTAFAIGEFRALLQAAKKIDEPKKSAHRGLPPEEGYHAVGQALLARSDVLIAVWDGERSRGKGGTVNVIEAARAKGIPVIWIHASKAQAPQWPATTPNEKRKNARRTKAPAS